MGWVDGLGGWVVVGCWVVVVMVVIGDWVGAV